MPLKDRQAYLEYQKRYSRLFRKKPIVVQKSTHISQIDTGYFKEESSEICCKKFGCGRTLTPEENLYGDFCIHHQHHQKTEPSNFVSFPHKQSA